MMKKRYWNSFALLLIAMLPISFSAQKAELIVQTGHSDIVRAVAFSPDGRLLASGSNDKTVKIWNAGTGKQVKTLQIETSVQAVVFSPDGKLLAASGDSDGIYIWETESGRLLRKLSEEKGVYRDMQFSRDGTTIASSGFEFVTLWNVETGEISRKIKAQTREYVASIAYSPDGTTLAASGWNKTVSLWNAESGERIKSFEGSEYAAINIAFSGDGKHLFLASQNKPIAVLNIESGELNNQTRTEKSFSVAVSPDAKMFASGVSNNDVIIWNADDGKELKRFTGHKDGISSVEFSPDGKVLASGSLDKTVRLWNVESGQELANVNSLSGVIDAIAVSQVGSVFAAGDSNKKVHIWNLESGGKTQTLDNKENIVQNIRFSPNGKLLASFGWNSNQIKIWDVVSGKLLHTFTEQADSMDSMDFSPDGKRLATASYGSPGSVAGTNRLSIWNVETGQRIKTFDAQSANLGVTFAKDGRSIVSASEHGTVIVWNIATGRQTALRPFDSPKDEKLLKSIAPNFFRGNQVEISVSDGKFQLRQESGSAEIKLYGTNPEKHLASLISVGERDWAVVTPEGLFDSSVEARKQMHFAVGFETVSLEQMKDVYYVPGLLRKIFQGEPLPKTELFSATDLFPLAEYDLPKPGEKEFSVKIRNRGGGIGQVQVFVNGKEFISDARPDGFDPNQPVAELKIDLENAPLIDGPNNRIEIVTRNAEGSITSRGTAAGTLENGGSRPNAPPNVYLIIGGISDYTGDNLDLRYAAKDAESIAKALDIGASRMFGADKVHLRLLTTSKSGINPEVTAGHAKVSGATKADFINAFGDFKSAQPNDIFIVYLAGHGVSLSTGQANSDTYLYLTQEATTNDKSVLAVENSRRAMAISSDELTDLIKQNRALKQVLILDTCAAGAVSSSLIGKRDLPSDQIRAIERLKDRTGFFVLMGSAANKVSYEATQYGQGLLTYSLLQGLKGAKLRENQFADVSLLFSYAQDVVPEMARYVGGIQRPLIIAPDSSSSFDIGRFTSVEQSQIKLSSLKPLILKPVLQNKDLDYDDLDLTALLRDELRNSSFTVDRETFETPFVFVDADEMIDAVKPSGSYVVRGNSITISVRLIKNKRPIHTISVTGSTSEKTQIVKRLVDAIKKQPL